MTTSEKDASKQPYNTMIDDLIAAHGDEMRLNKKGKWGGVFDTPKKPVLRKIKKILDDAGVPGVPVNIRNPQSYKTIERILLDMPQQQAEELKLRNILPPPHVHMMARHKGLFFDLRNSDVIAASIQNAGMKIEPYGHYLDFGCSSGRTVRTFDLAYPRAFWHGVDPVEESIHFARMMLPQASFQVSKQDPPLSFSPNTFSGIMALSIWSHFSVDTGKTWLAEMRRIVRPGGFLLFTTHGYSDICAKMQNKKASLETFTILIAEMEKTGYFFRNDIRDGHRGLDTQTWGTTFMTRDWVEKNYLSAGWEVAYWAPGQWGNRQDVYVLKAV